MWHYEPPLRDMRYVIEDVLGLPAQWARLPAFAELDAETAQQVLDEAAKFARGVLAPTNAGGDLEGCHWADGEVLTPKGFREAHRAFVDAGWPALACAPEHGGQCLPQVLNADWFELLAAANHAWTVHHGLLHGACECLQAQASPELKAACLGKVASGEWLATMCLTEAQVGSDPEFAYRVPDDFLRAAGRMPIVQAWARERDTAQHCFSCVLPELAHALHMPQAGRAPLAPLPFAV